MEMSVREARAQFAKALAAAKRGERVTITRNGEPVAELGPPTAKIGGIDWDRVAAARKELGLDRRAGPPLDEAWRRQFDDPAFSRKVMRVDDEGEPINWIG
jgi:prevent-host-death family protein